MKKKQIGSQNTSYLTVDNEVIVEVGDDFVSMTGFSKNSIIMKSLEKVCTEYLKLTHSVDELYGDSRVINCSLFTKNLKVREVTIKTQNLDINRKILYFTEKLQIRLEDKLVYLEQLCENNLAYVAIYSIPDLVLINASQKYIDFFDKPYNSKFTAIGLKLCEFSPKWFDPSADAHWNDLITTGQPFTSNELRFTNRMRDETYWDFTVTSIFAEGIVKYCVVTATDVTNVVKYRKQVQTQSQLLLHQQEQLEAIIENMSDALFIVNSEGKYIILNKEARKHIYPYSFENTHEFYETCKCMDTEDNEIAFNDLPTSRVLRGEKVEQEIVKASNEYKELILSVSGVPVYNNEGSFLFGVMCARDITELYKNNKMKDEFLTVISHEFRTPLTIINSAIQTMELICKEDLSEKAKGYLNLIRQNAFRQIRLINNLLDVTKINAEKLSVHKKNYDIVFLTKALIDSVQLCARQKGVHLTFSSNLDQKIIEIDEEKFERIMLNLLSNAIKFTPKNKAIQVNLTSAKGFVKIDVKDEGIGIPKDKQEIIFKRFGQVDSSLTRKTEGTGIGLSLVKMLAYALEGEISVKSEVDKGSTFSLLLPVKKATENCSGQYLQELTNYRLIQAINIEFSDIYYQ
ncbi:MAG: PAS domain-containing sensor histidine kinase [Clostridia bacterium]|nr:PAS domain-containing sensor histidine kinase [Clostridia bacterium]